MNWISIFIVIETYVNNSEIDEGKFLLILFMFK